MTASAQPELQGKACIVVGGGSIAPGWGIGKALAVAYARAGARVLVTDVSSKAAAETAAIITGEGNTAISRVMDATDPASVEAGMQHCLETFGRIDVLHNNVGIGKSGPSQNTTVDDWRRIADANLLALHIACQAAVPHMIARGSGVVLATSSIASLRYIGSPHLAYGVTKAGANHFMRLMAAEHAASGIRFNSIVVGLVDTPRIRHTMMGSYGGNEEEMIRKRNAQVPMGFMGDAWDVANAAVFLASDRARYITGTELILDGGLSTTMRSGS